MISSGQKTMTDLPEQYTFCLDRPCCYCIFTAKFKLMLRVDSLSLEGDVLPFISMVGDPCLESWSSYHKEHPSEVFSAHYNVESV